MVFITRSCPNSQAHGTSTREYTGRHFSARTQASVCCSLKSSLVLSFSPLFSLGPRLWSHTCSQSLPEYSPGPELSESSGQRKRLEACRCKNVAGQLCQGVRPTSSSLAEQNHTLLPSPDVPCRPPSPGMKAPFLSARTPSWSFHHRPCLIFSPHFFLPAHSPRQCPGVVIYHLAHTSSSTLFCVPRCSSPVHFWVPQCFPLLLFPFDNTLLSSFILYHPEGGR